MSFDFRCRTAGCANETETGILCTQCNQKRLVAQSERLAGLSNDEVMEFYHRVKQTSYINCATPGCLLGTYIETQGPYCMLCDSKRRSAAKQKQKDKALKESYQYLDEVRRLKSTRPKINTKK